MANLSKCKRCGGEVDSSSPHATNKTFCGSRCQKQWWNEVRSGKITRGEWASRRYGPVPQKELSEVERVWLAAILDAEGTIGVYRNRISRNKSGYKYIPSIKMSNTCEALVEHFRKLTDCWSSVQKKPAHTERHKPYWSVEIKHRSLRAFLPQILPHLIAKRRQAEILLEFLAEMEGAPMRTSTTHESFERYWLQTKALNKKGPP